MEDEKKLKLKFILNFLLSRFYNILIGEKGKNLGFFEMILQKWLDVNAWVDTFFEKNNACKFKNF